MSSTQCEAAEEIPFGAEDSQRPFFYRLISRMAASGFRLFFSDVEVVGTANFPRNGPCIIAFNHTNSLTDPMGAVAICPRHVRFTGKDALLDDPLFGWAMRWGDLIPIKRRMDYGGSVQDNSHAFDALFAELEQSCCIGLFPEGLGNYVPFLSPFKVGAAQIAIRFILNQQNRKEAKYKYVNLIPIGFSYLHRAMFRSSVSIRIGEPILIAMDKIQSLGVDALPNATEKQISVASKQLIAQLQRGMENIIVSAPSWRMLCISHLARQIVFPESSSPRHGCRLVHYVDLTRQFVDIFKQYCEIPSQTTTTDTTDTTDTTESESKSESVSELVSESNSINSELVMDTYNELQLYFDTLYQLGLKDNRIIEISRVDRDNAYLYFGMSAFCRMILRLFCAVPLFIIAMPGCIASIPILILWRIAKHRIIVASTRRFYDGLAQKKILVAWFGTIILGAIYSGIYLYQYRSITQSLCLFALYFVLIWSAVRASEELFSNIRSIRSLFRMLCLKRSVCEKVVKCRAKVCTKVTTIVDRFGVTVNRNLVSKLDLQRSRIAFNRDSLLYLICRRAKSDWNETLRFRDIPSDRFHLQQTLSTERPKNE